jgi:hypothetical protein
MSTPELRRLGDSFLFTWQDQAIGIGLDRRLQSRDGLIAEITVESTPPGFDGHIHGPAKLNLLSTESQNRLAKVLDGRVNHVDWHAMLVTACNMATAKFRQPPPVIDLAKEPDPGPVDLLLPSIPRGDSTVIYGDGEGGKSLVLLLIAMAATTAWCCPGPPASRSRSRSCCWIGRRRPGR